MSLPHLLLGLLSSNPMSGYDLNKVFNTTIQHFWTTDQSQIYRTLYKLEEEGKVEVETVIQEDNPNKKVYHITEKGTAELHDWLAKRHASATIREAWLGQLFFGYEVDDTTVISVLESRVADLESHLRVLEAFQATLPATHSWGQTPHEYRFQLLTLDYGIEAYRFDIEWLKKVIEQIQGFGD
jgi:PadR family transcriptional regulator AphA